MALYDPFLQWLDHQKSEMSSLVERWGNINSHVTNLEGLRQQLEELKKSFTELHGEVQEIELPPHSQVDDKGKKHDRQSGKALHIVKRSNAPVKILFSGHMDTVYDKNSPFQKVQYLDANRMNGPGVLDMKAGLVIMLYTLLAFEKTPWAKKIGWEILITPDEEIGSPSSKEVIKRTSKRNHYGFVFEPSLLDGAFVSHRAGSKNINILVHGKMAHSGRDFALGKSAIFAASEIISNIEKLNGVHDNVVVNVGQINSGTGFNVVPDLAVIRCNIRAGTKALMDETTKKLYEIVKSAEKRDGITCEVIEQTGNPPKEETEGSKKILRMIEMSAQELKIPFKTGYSKGVTEGNTMAAEGLPVIDSLGGRGGKIHTHEEYLEIDSLVERSKLLALLLMKLANGEFDEKNSPDSIIAL